MKQLPLDTESLILQLDETYPARCIKPGETLEEHLRYAGLRSLVDTLMGRLKSAEGIQTLNRRKVN